MPVIEGLREAARHAALRRHAQGRGRARGARRRRDRRQRRRGGRRAADVRGRRRGRRRHGPHAHEGRPADDAGRSDLRRRRRRGARRTCARAVEAAAAAGSRATGSASTRASGSARTWSTTSSSCARSAACALDLGRAVPGRALPKAVHRHADGDRCPADRVEGTAGAVAWLRGAGRGPRARARRPGDAPGRAGRRRDRARGARRDCGEAARADLGRRAGVPRRRRWAAGRCCSTGFPQLVVPVARPCGAPRRAVPGDRAGSAGRRRLGHAGGCTARHRGPDRVRARAPRSTSDVDRFGVVGASHGGGIAQLLALDGRRGRHGAARTRSRVRSWPSDATRAIQDRRRSSASTASPRAVIRTGFDLGMGHRPGCPSSISPSTSVRTRAPRAASRSSGSPRRSTARVSPAARTASRALEIPVLILWGEDDPLHADRGRRAAERVDPDLDAGRSCPAAVTSCWRTRSTRSGR